jgi:hypothetical protein
MKRKYIDKEASCSAVDDLFGESSEDDDYRSTDDYDDTSDSKESESETESENSSDDNDTEIARQGRSLVPTAESAVPSVTQTTLTQATPEQVVLKEGVPGFSRYNPSQWSLTITKTGADVAAQDLEVLFLFFVHHCIKGGVALEVGPRAHNLHFQGVFECLYPTAPAFAKKMNLFVKKLFNNNGRGHRFLLKPLAATQTLKLMCGYIMKDEGQHWFAYRVHNISQEDLHQGKMTHMAQLTSIDEGKVVLTHRNLFKEMFKFQKRTFEPLVPPLRYMVLYAIQSGYYLPAGTTYCF